MAHLLRDVRVATLLVSLCLSLWCTSVDDVINSDGILYVGAAEDLAKGNWRAASATYNWLFYPWLMAVVSRVAGTDVEVAAHCINAVCDALTAVAFVSIVKLLGGGGKVLVFAALVVLCYPSFNDYRAYVIRDHGYLAFFSLGLLFLLHYEKKQTWRSALSWGTAMVLATLFRIEGILFLVLVPLILLFQKDRSLRGRAFSYLRANVILIAAATGLFVWWSFAGQSRGFDLVRWSRLNNPIGYLEVLTKTLTEDLPRKADVLAREILHPGASAYGLSILAAAVVIILLTETLRTLTPFFGLLAGHGFILHRGSYRRTSRVWLAFLCLNFCYLLVVVLLRFNLTGRSALSFAMASLVWVPFSLARLFDRWRERRSLPLSRNWLFPVVAVLFLVLAGDGLISTGPRKTHIKEAGRWMRDNLPPEVRVYSNDFTLRYYAGRARSKQPRKIRWEETAELLKANPWSEYDVLALRIRRNRQNRKQELLALLEREPTKVFASSRGDQILLFRAEPKAEE